jgi:small subunit ribosomal protein S16
MLKIRLKKYGRKKRPSYRIVVIDSKKRRDGRPIEEIGFYNPLTNETIINLEKINTYTRNGAQRSKIVTAICAKAIKSM